MIASRSIIFKAASFQSAVFSTLQRQIAPSTKKKFTEVEIKVPWGKIAGKLWNPNDTQPILALHGWQENAGSFDNLVPLLPEEISVLSIDLPGHGLSSWLPEGIIYNQFMYLQAIHRTRQHFGWDKIKLMGHSLGGLLSFSYSCLFSDDVKFVFAFDFMKFRFHSASAQATNAAKDFTSFLQFEKSKTPSFGITDEQVIARLMESTENSLDEAACRTLMIRGVTKESDGTVHVNRDPKVKFVHLGSSLTYENVKEQAGLVKSPFFVVKAENWDFMGFKSHYYDDLEKMMRNSADFKMFSLPGKHHIHMTDPEPIAKLIIPLLEKYY